MCDVRCATAADAASTKTADMTQNIEHPTPEIAERKSGRAYWRSLGEYADSPAFRAKLEQEFEGYDPETLLSVSRRGFLKLASASMALAGVTLTGCRRWPEEKLAPYANQPDGRVPGIPVHYATMDERGGVATGLLVESFDGRPIKVEGNPAHPYSLGATDPQHQASLLDMYDPERSTTVRTKGGAASTWQAFEQAVAEITNNPQARLAILSEACSSPSLARLRTALFRKLPQARWYEYEPISRTTEARGAEQAFGRAVRPIYDFGEAKIIAAFDSDFLNAHPGSIRWSRQWAQGRRSADHGQMSRMYVAESAPSCTGSVADVRLPIRSSDIPSIVAAVAGGVGVQGVSFTIPEGAKSFVDHLVADLQANRGASILIAGSSQPAQVQALVWQINAALGNLGQTISMVEEPPTPGGTDNAPAGTIAQLAEALNAGNVEAVVILGSNPIYDAPAELNFPEALAKAKVSVHLSSYYDETSAASAWHLPRAHFLESWGDGRAWDGTISVQQPIILPLYDGRSPIELLALLAGEQELVGYDIVRTTFRELLNAGGNFEQAWRKVLHEGLVEGSAFAAVEGLTPRAGAGVNAETRSTGGEYEVTFHPSNVYDGRYANNGWLQELPGPLTKLTWDNTAWISFADAQELGVEQGEILTISVNGRELRIPAYIMPGQARRSIAVQLGYGRRAPQINVPNLTIADGVGANASVLRTIAAPDMAMGAKVSATGAIYPLATTTEHWLLNHEPFDVTGEALQARVGNKGESGLIIKEATLAEYLANPEFVHLNEHGDYTLQMYSPPDVKYPQTHPDAPKVFNNPHAWGMAIDMNACMGCSACMVACQAENNIPIVGKDQVMMSREMHWIRIDRYWKTDPHAEGAAAENPDVVFQPMLCVHCESAPCEEVCPVAATVHDTEGINTMVYNRCIGTRYCSNNCPYKVRRFNYFDWHSKPVNNTELPMLSKKPWLGMPDSEQREEVGRIRRMGYNPDVTVRMRGVMEKCTYCTQRVARAKQTAKIEWQQGKRKDNRVQDGEVVVACEQACPTGAIVFGDLNDPNSRVSQAHKNHRTYTVLDDLNTRARGKHMAKIRNPATT